MKGVKKTIFLMIPLLIVEIFLMGSVANSKQAFQASVEVLAEQSPTKETPAPQPVEVPTIKVAFIMEMQGEHKILFDQAKDQQVPVASLTKFMTALAAMDSYDVYQKTTISLTAMAVHGEQGQLKLGEELSVRNLLYIMLIESSNRAAQALAEIMGHKEFIALMNKKAGDIGLTQTYFSGVTGLSSSTRSTASDVAKLSTHLFENYPLFREIIELPEYSLYVNGYFHHTLVNTNKLLRQDGIIGGKTGWTDEAQGCMVAIQNINGRHIVYVVLGMEDRFAEVKKLIDMHL